MSLSYTLAAAGAVHKGKTLYKSKKNTYYLPGRRLMPNAKKNRTGTYISMFFGSMLALCLVGIFVNVARTNTNGATLSGRENHKVEAASGPSWTTYVGMRKIIGSRRKNDETGMFELTFKIDDHDDDANWIKHRIALLSPHLAVCVPHIENGRANIVARHLRTHHDLDSTTVFFVKCR